MLAQNHVLSQRERGALKNLLKGLPIERACNWLIGARLDNERGVGWPHLTAQDMPTVWGGTADGARALVVAGMSRFDPVIAEAFEWLLTQQRADGGFGSREIVYSAVEATAWVLVLLQAMGVDPTSEEYSRRAIEYLDSCVTDEGGVGTSASDPVRIYSSCVSLWTLRGYSEKAVSIARFLKDSRDVRTGGWGTKPGAVPNALSTAHVLNVLLMVNQLSKEDVIAQQAVEYLLSQQQEDGSWDNFSETWFSIHQPHVPLRCDEYSTTWALTALLRAGLSPTSVPVARAISWLVRGQQDEGFWLYDPLDDSQHIWCTADSIVALCLARQRLLGTVSESEVWEQAVWNGVAAQEPGGKAVDLLEKMVTLLRENLTLILIVVLAMYVFRAQINRMIGLITGFLRLQSHELVSDVIANIVYALLAVLGTLVLNKLRKRAGR